MKRTCRPRRTQYGFSAFKARIASALFAALLRIQRKVENSFTALCGIFSARRNIAISVAGHEKIDRHRHLEYYRYATRDGKLIVAVVNTLRRRKADCSLYRIRYYAGRGNVQYHVFGHSYSSRPRTRFAVCVGKRYDYGDLYVARHASVTTVFGNFGNGRLLI